jgi:hypothetical protein
MSKNGHHSHPLDPDLISTEKELPKNIEDMIKEGFFEMRHKFKQEGPASIYINHNVLH